MFALPPIPPFEALHPLVVHFPIGILLIAWIPMLLAIIDKKRRNPWLASAAMLLTLGTIACFAATLTGDAAEDVVASTSAAVDTAIHDHEETAESARNLFLACTLVFLMVWAVANKVPDKKKPTIALTGGLLIAITYTLATLTLANAAHLGGVLVHGHGVHAPVVE
ncbi:MAG: hypothetical protein CMJ35_13465 [Phycisphaerae bacterium]|nr:hypothetical protein [Phycisphaerae bacterium]